MDAHGTLVMYMDYSQVSWVHFEGGGIFSPFVSVSLFALLCLSGVWLWFGFALN